MDFFKKEHFWTFWTKKNPKKSKKSKTVLAPQAPTKMIHDGIGGAAGASQVAAGGRPAAVGGRSRGQDWQHRSYVSSLVVRPDEDDFPVRVTRSGES